LKKIAFTLIGGKAWLGGLNYQINLFTALSAYQHNRVAVNLFVGTDIDTDILNKFEKITSLTIIKSDAFNRDNINKRLLNAILTGLDTLALHVFSEHMIDVVFENANFYGWRFPLPVIAWMPDFQHRHMPEMFSRYAYWKRELGYWLQLSSNRFILLSSQDAKLDCQKFYPRLTPSIRVINFAVPSWIDCETLPDVEKIYSLPKDYYYLPNQFWKHKNQACAVEALKILVDGGKDFFLVSSGKKQGSIGDNYFNEVVDLVNRYGLERNIKFLGEIPYDHVRALMLGCKSMINSSKFEGWSTTVEEAKANGVPMILSDIKVHLEQAEDRACFFNPNIPKSLALVLDSFNKEQTNHKRDTYTIKNEAEDRFKFFSNEFAHLVGDVFK
jgi:glycosyltransferase involved in cell wall biosynthesis